MLNMTILSHKNKLKITETCGTLFAVTMLNFPESIYGGQQEVS